MRGTIEELVASAPTVRNCSGAGEERSDRANREDVSSGGNNDRNRLHRLCRGRAIKVREAARSHPLVKANTAPSPRPTSNPNPNTEPATDPSTAAPGSPIGGR
jgi:hypothetical protein